MNRIIFFAEQTLPACALHSPAKVKSTFFWRLSKVGHSKIELGGVVLHFGKASFGWQEEPQRMRNGYHLGFEFKNFQFYRYR